MQTVIQYADDTKFIRLASTDRLLEEQTYILANVCLQYFKSLNLRSNLEKKNYYY